MLCYDAVILTKLCFPHGILPFTLITMFSTFAYKNGDV